MMYRLLRRIIRISLAVFFKKLVVTGKEHIPSEGPLIIVANHPSTFMDPLIMAVLLKQRIGFLGNGGLFANKLFAKVLGYFHVIPIYRKKDVKPGEKRDNKQSFAKCHEYLAANGTLLIFPEGNSYYELNLRQIKTGTARIALSFEDDVQILPIALDYSDSIQFRSMVSITVNPPISVATYRSAYAEDEVTGVKALTEGIRTSLAQHIPQTSGKKQEAFLIKAHAFYTTFHEPTADLHQDAKRSLELRNQVSQALTFLQKADEPLYQTSQAKVFSFFDLLQKEGVTVGFFTEKFLKKNRLLVCLGYFLQFLLLLPIYLFGLLTNYLPYILPSQVFNALKIDIEYKAPVQMVVGIITFPLFYWLELWLFRKYVSADMGHSLLFLAAIPIAGYITMYSYTEAKRFMRVLRFYFVVKPQRKAELLALRDEILGIYEKIRKQELLKDLFGAWPDTEEDLVEVIYESRTSSDREIKFDDE